MDASGENRKVATPTLERERKKAKSKGAGQDGNRKFNKGQVQ